MAFKKYRKSSKKTYKKKAYKKKSSRLSKPMKNAIKRIVRGQQETYNAGHIIEVNVAHNSPISAGDCYPILPIVNQGTTDYNRRGDTIVPISCTIKGYVAINEDIVDQYTPCVVRVMVLEQKNIKTQAQLSSTFAASSLLKVNDASTSVNTKQFVGSSQDLLYPINTDLFKVHCDKLITLIPTYYPTFNVDLAPSKAFAKWSCKVPLPKKLHYPDDAATLPDNCCPFVCIGYGYPNGHSPDTLTPTLVKSNNFAMLKYKDA